MDFHNQSSKVKDDKVDFVNRNANKSIPGDQDSLVRKSFNVCYLNNMHFMSTTSDCQLSIKARKNWFAVSDAVIPGC